MESTVTAGDHPPAVPPQSGKYRACGNAFDDGNRIFLTKRFWNAVTWTQVTSDNDLVDQLLQLYLRQETGHRVVIAASPFLDNMEGKRTEYCNSALVNAILAFACTVESANRIFVSRQDCFAAGNAFCAESNWHLCQSSHTLMDVLALGTLSMRELTLGNDILGAKLSDRSIRLAFELGCHLGLQGTNSDDTVDFNMSLYRLATFFLSYIHQM